jgi:DNA-binding transcriptional LysR family regulator
MCIIAFFDGRISDGRISMELRQLATFRMLATTLNFTQTAVLLGYVQSSVTAQIQALEAELGVALFDRLNKRVVLTDAGQRLLIYAEKLLSLAEEAQTSVAEDGEPKGAVTMSAPETLCTYRLPAVWNQFRATFPHIQVHFRPLPVSELRRSVLEGRVDVAFLLEEPLQATGLVVEPLIRESLLVIAPPDHPLLQRTVVTPADLEDEPVLLTEVGCSYRNLFKRTLAVAGVYPKTNLELNSVEAIKQCVMVGMGITVLPAVAVQLEVSQGRLVALPWNIPGFEVVTQMIWHKDKWQSPALKAFLSLSREILRATF